MFEHSSSAAQGVKQRCTLHLGVPMQPMLAKVGYSGCHRDQNPFEKSAPCKPEVYSDKRSFQACTSIQELLKRILGSMPHKAKRGQCGSLQSRPQI